MKLSAGLIHCLDHGTEMLQEAVERAAEGERVTLYIHAGDGAGDMQTCGFFNTAAAGIILDRVCDDALRGHTSGACAHCDAVAIAIMAAKRAFHAALDDAKAGACTDGGRA